MLPEIRGFFNFFFFLADVCLQLFAFILLLLQKLMRNSEFWLVFYNLTTCAIKTYEHYIIHYNSDNIKNIKFHFELILLMVLINYFCINIKYNII